jgi:hypothetical protein
VDINWENALLNLTSVSVILFGIGFAASRLGSSVRLPDSFYDAITIFLLVGIGLKGGVALRENLSTDIILPLAATIALGLVTPLLAYYGLAAVKGLDKLNRGSISAHYGSTSLVTFTAALFYLDSIGVTYEGFVASLLVIVEVAGLSVGVMLGARTLKPRKAKASIRGAINEVIFGKTIFLLVGALIAGLVSGPIGYTQVEPFFSTILPGVLGLFLLHLGHVAGSRFDEMKKPGIGLAVFAIIFPIVAGTLGVVAGSAIGLSIGGATVLATLLASASYIAAPAAVSIALPTANPSLAIAPALAVTFPFNLILGIPLYYTVAVVVASALNLTG